MELMNAKGTRDFLPEDKILRQEITDKLRVIFEKYGYNPLETPILERFDVLSAKYAGGAEILKETFKLQDQGGRELGLRYDLTVPFSRVIASNKQLRMPFKRYQIDRVFRDGPIKLGRTREFWQCDVDVVGCKSMLADAEMIAIASDFFKSIGIEVVIKVNNRKVLDSIMREAGIPIEKREEAILILDKLEKIGEKGVRKEMAEKGIECEKMLNIVKSEKLVLDNDDGLKELQDLERFLNLLKVENFQVDYTLARGLSYYTGTVFEIKCKEIDSSIGGGGRYDEMISNFVGSGDYPAVGISFGLEPIFEILKSRQVKKTVVQLFVIPIKCLDECLYLIQELRDVGVNVDLDFNGRSISKNLDFVNKMGIPFALIVGSDELKAKKFTLKNMVSGEEKKLSIYGVLKELKCCGCIPHANSLDPLICPH